MSDFDLQSDVAIAGAGPVGMTAALILARRGVRVTVLEAGSDLSSESRASTFHPPTLEMLDQLGLVEPLMELGLRVDTFQYRDRRTGLIAEFDLSLLSGDTKYPHRIQCEQSKLTRIIRERLTTIDHAVLEFDARVEHVEQDTDGVTTVLADGRRVRSRYLIGADGANSKVRRDLDIGFEGVTYPERYLVISTEQEIRDLLPDISYVNYISDPEEWLVLLRTPEHWRAMFPVDPDLDDAQAQDPVAVQRRMKTIADLGHDWPILHTTLYRVHQRVADSYRVGRVLLAGDAAHINNPLGGLGMNSGVHDAYMLAPLLAAVMAGDEDDDVLDTYAETRRQVSVDYVSREADKNWRRIRERDEDERQRQQRELRETVSDPQKALTFVRKTCMLSDEAMVPAR